MVPWVGAQTAADGEGSRRTTLSPCQCASHTCLPLLAWPEFRPRWIAVSTCSFNSWDDGARPAWHVAGRGRRALGGPCAPHTDHCLAHNVPSIPAAMDPDSTFAVTPVGRGSSSAHRKRYARMNRLDFVDPGQAGHTQVGRKWSLELPRI